MKRRIHFRKHSTVEFADDELGTIEEAIRLANAIGGDWHIDSWCDDCEAWHCEGEDKPHRCERCDVCLGDGSTADHCDECAEKFDDDDDDPDWRGAGSWR